MSHSKMQNSFPANETAWLLRVFWGFCVCVAWFPFSQALENLALDSVYLKAEELKLNMRVPQESRTGRAAKAAWLTHSCEGTKYLESFLSGSPPTNRGMCWWALQEGQHSWKDGLTGYRAFTKLQETKVILVPICELQANRLCWTGTHPQEWATSLCSLVNNLFLASK